MFHTVYCTTERFNPSAERMKRIIGNAYPVDPCSAVSDGRTYRYYNVATVLYCTVLYTVWTEVFPLLPLPPFLVLIADIECLHCEWPIHLGWVDSSLLVIG